MISTSKLDMIRLFLSNYLQNKHITTFVIADTSVLTIPVKAKNSFGLHF